MVDGAMLFLFPSSYLSAAGDIQLCSTAKKRKKGQFLLLLFLSQHFCDFLFLFVSLFVTCVALSALT